MDSILGYEAFGIASGAYSSMKNNVLMARAKGEERLTLLIRGDRASGILENADEYGYTLTYRKGVTPQQGRPREHL